MNCEACFHHCLLKEKGHGLCYGFTLKDRKVSSDNYGLVTAMALDPIEKKPLREFYPHTKILSVGFYGCNLHCPFCQNYDISQTHDKSEAVFMSPNEVVARALSLKEQGNIGVAFTYNEPLVAYPFVRDCAKLALENKLHTVLVTNGCFSNQVLEEVGPYIEAMNIDLKGFSEEFYSWVGGSLKMVLDFIKEASKTAHIELTTLIIPGKNDSPLEMEKEAQWISSISPDIPLHLSRYFPRYKCDLPMTPLATLYELEAIAKKYLKSVYIGNI